MGLEMESRRSDSPYIERVWRSRSSGVSQMLSVASARLELVFWEQQGRMNVAVQGPETRASRAPVPEEATFIGISFALGVSMPHLPLAELVDGNLVIPGATRRSFHLKGSSWQVPGFDDAESFVERLVRAEVLVRDPLVASGGGPVSMVSERTVQRRFLAATGLTRNAVRQIDRARAAAVLIQEGVPAVEVVHRLGYFDQPHLARSLARFVGRTATRLAAPDASEPLSLIYRSEEF
jgi:hypothetical protein